MNVEQRYEPTCRGNASYYHEEAGNSEDGISAEAFGCQAAEKCTNEL